MLSATLVYIHAQNVCRLGLCIAFRKQGPLRTQARLHGTLGKAACGRVCVCICIPCSGRGHGLSQSIILQSGFFSYFGALRCTGLCRGRCGLHYSGVWVPLLNGLFSGFLENWADRYLWGEDDKGMRAEQRQSRMSATAPAWSHSSNIVGSQQTRIDQIALRLANCSPCTGSLHPRWLQTGVTSSGYLFTEVRSRWYLQRPCSVLGSFKSLGQDSGGLARSTIVCQCLEASSIPHGVEFWKT